MRVGELARRTGTTVRALRYYESTGLVVPRRLRNGYREYDPIAERRVAQIRQLLSQYGHQPAEAHRRAHRPARRPRRPHRRGRARRRDHPLGHQRGARRPDRDPPADTALLRHRRTAPSRTRLHTLWTSCAGSPSAAQYRVDLYSDPQVRAAQSAWGFVDETATTRAVDRLRADLDSGVWDTRYGHFRTQPQFAGSLRLIVGRP
ncbi:MAG TPA: MerR family transcriptional regulator [Actinoplanes sp.]